MLYNSHLSNEQLEAEYKRLVKELDEGRKHPEYPFIDAIPGYIWAQDRLDEVTNELQDRGVY